MKTYLEIHVPLKNDAEWFEELRNVCQKINVKWQMGYYHCIFKLISYLCIR